MSVSFSCRDVCRREVCRDVWLTRHVGVAAKRWMKSDTRFSQELVVMTGQVEK